ncbi:hypothetical protein [Colwellia sp. PAMC 21821]|uniref:hypothetical protein n=1 Tax=Colwellia sp. PAMC 21821 TaxID=1816219 RepID=UPI0009BDD4FB|nr:hypothetical protein [Colwellia sp. PAMC 21821]ARD46022.1 hypothetical protein A3Q33_18035 [Colwellia sp. PAMC 21821]
MSVIKPLLLFTMVALSACAYQPTPYKVVQQEKYEQGALAGLYQLGVTEERISQSEYVITVKLDGGSDPQRARNMLMLHASKLALTSGYKHFKKSQLKAGSWCNKSRNKVTNKISFAEGGPSAKAKVSFVHANESNFKKNKTHFNAEKLIERLEPIVNKVITQEVADSNANKRMRICWNKR